MSKIYYEGFWKADEPKPLPEHRINKQTNSNSNSNSNFWTNSKNTDFLNQFTHLLEKCKQIINIPPHMRIRMHNYCLLCNHYFTTEHCKMYEFTVNCETGNSIYYIASNLEHYFAVHKIVPSDNLINLITQISEPINTILNEWVFIETPLPTKPLPI